MIDPLSWALQITATAATLSSHWLMGNKRTSGPAIGIIGDAAFFALNAYVGLWALLPVCAMSAFIHTRNFIKWKKEA